ncbi:MAG: hypothetical protein J7455_18250 [Roseiflexus sp.]|jgi:hypothetical protein|nr:hypothetical protein [Roseiflexus sp.]MBO9384434.1 hypothetical protein [Roseiflexus sp.]MBO9391236.1 hypothetical protein [Roseiflexus sp.]
MARKLVLSLVAIAVFFSFSLRAAASPIEAPATANPMLPRARWHAIRVPISCLSPSLQRRLPLPTSRRLQ